MTSIAALLAEVRDLDRQATPGPWEARRRPTAGLEVGNVVAGVCCLYNDNNTVTARLIARYRTLAPLLADEVERLQAELAATQRAKAENDERFMIERDEARRELDDERRFIGVYRAATTEALGIDPRSCADDVREAIGGFRAELLETRLTLAAEQGKPEGAPSKRWRYRVRNGIPEWIGAVEATGGYQRVEQSRAWTGETVAWLLLTFDGLGVQVGLTSHPNARAAMLAADAALRESEKLS